LGLTFEIYFGIFRNMEIKHAIQALQSLAQETRLAIFRLLVKAGPEGLAAGEIAQVLGIPAPTLSFHLTHLRNAGLLEQRRDGRSLVYSVSFSQMRDLLAFLMEDCCQGRSEICGGNEQCNATSEEQGGPNVCCS